MDWDDVAEAFLGALLAGIVLQLVLVPLVRRRRGRLARRRRAGRRWRFA